MTKKEQRQVDETIAGLKLQVALRWTEPVAPDVPPPDGSSALTVGWLTCYNRVEPACSSCVHHGSGTTTRTTTQGARTLFSTRLRALKALRHEMELRFAAELRQLDAQIETEQAKPTPLPL
jgi:hypothetical protein